ncbi:molybdopterin-binding protein [Methylobacterium sp. Leaf123]|uniref:molybdopterin-binding protein n=1 Tax=Methylobacterium sp. Leaf123 TaxID=1736264 RepID=UPI0006FA80F1|nr:molybdopterin-binding protein [Methylobacterium sp. Leaf123]KQQ31826.1 molybdopterin-binding protein [Methylobacterium sp. Leaf123]
MRAPSAALTPLADALALLLRCATPVAPQSVPLVRAAGHIAATSLAIAQDIPAGLIALRDGFAVEAAQIGGASPYAPVMLPRTPVWVEAGERLPPGTDAVLPAEGLEHRSAVAEIGPGEGTRAAGEDFSEGDALLAAGERIEPRRLLGLAAAGFSEIAIREARIRLVVTGAPDFLSPALNAVIARAGGLTETVVVADDPDQIARAIAADGADAVFVLGGTGFGRSDHSAEGLAQAGRVIAHGLALRPGETAGIGEAGERPVLLLPGRPDAALAALLALGLPLVAALTGALQPVPRMANIARKITSTVGLSEVVFVRVLGPEIEPLGGADLALRRLIETDGFVLVPPEREGYPAGSVVEVVPL